ncbi:type II toxin-antitoxin system HicB family antitoxin [Sphingobium fuliginis]|jgi:predicted RNase H-like HicB family nuclease|uniref:Type II toxin-antitoxin system HicB family antitoxin n=1 Tax=Sphingobium fuliginis (strain ATCC 27551) TaxID=336203 RepID=A0A7M2GIE0_SPHSA|nr:MULTISPECIES: type II toxin-antitoxin system HicB family antitoxin [Sphingobium]PNQ02131.1 CopG family transcriptional regulator [Sphingobium sp. SA916]QOT71739.1 type II toxin-antitoxin system HicB family antitoxin [Sphingobium fuliginis]
MKYFYAIVHKDADSAFGVSFPDLPGCFSAADRQEDVLPNAVEALELWFEDAEEVDPRPVDQVREAVKEDLAQGAFLLAVPRITSANKLARVNLSLDRGMLDAIDQAAALRKLTRSAFMAEAARNEIEGRH